MCVFNAVYVGWEGYEGMVVSVLCTYAVVVSIMDMVLLLCLPAQGLQMETII